MIAMAKCCSNCGAELGLTFEVLDFIRGSEFALGIWDIYEKFPDHNPKAIRRILLTLKAKELVVQPQRGYYSA